MGTATGLAWVNGILHVAYRDRNLIALYDGSTGEHMTNWTVESPGRIAARNDGSLVAISGNQIVSVKDNVVTTVATADLDHPTGVTVSADNTVYVANAGELQNVSVFAADGRFLRSIGKPGGRPAVGRYDSKGIYMPGGIALDADERLWVSETTDSPKRHSVWDTGSGTCVNEFFGAQYHARNIGAKLYDVAPHRFVFEWGKGKGILFVNGREMVSAALPAAQKAEGTQLALGHCPKGERGRQIIIKGLKVYLIP